jgi:Platelet-activating factor acetylhydrolase, isoform II
MTRRMTHVLWRTILAVAGAGVLAVCLLLAMLRREHGAVLELPVPTGPFAVGRVSTAWVDTGRADPYSPIAGQPREVVVWIWYPAQAGVSEAAAYLPRAWQAALAAHAGRLLTEFLMRAPTQVRGHSHENAAVATDRSSYPVIVFRSGLGALALDYSTLAEDLASHGYIVVGTDAPWSTSVVVMPDGRVVESTTEGNPGDAPMAETERSRLLESLLGVWTADTGFVLDGLARLNESDPSGLFTGRMALGSVGVAGHSFGGATAAQFCHDDERCRAGMDLDGALFGSVVREGVEKPFLFLLSEHGDEWASESCGICRDIRSAAAASNAPVFTLIGAHHFSFSDVVLTRSRLIMSVIAAIGPAGGLAPRTGLALTTRYVREFFDAHLRGVPGVALQPGSLLPGVRLETR